MPRQQPDVEHRGPRAKEGIIGTRKPVRPEALINDFNQLFQGILNNISAVVMVRDTHGRLLLANRQVEILSGMPVDGAIGKTPHDFFARDFADKIMREDRTVLETKRPLNTRSSMYLNNVLRDFQITKMPMCDATGTPYAICVIATDVTELKVAQDELQQAQAELEQKVVERTRELVKTNQHLKQEIEKRKLSEVALRNNVQLLETLLDTIPNPVFLMDAKGQYQGCNTAFSELIYGLPKQRIIGNTQKTIEAEYRKSKGPLLNRPDLDLIRQPGIISHEGEVHCADGIVRGFVYNKATYLDPQGELAGMVVVMLDITQRKRAEKKLQKRTIDLRERIKELNCLYSISELREAKNLPLPNLLKNIVNLIPDGLRFPDMTSARIRIGKDQIFDSEGFVDSQWRHTSDIIITGQPQGSVEVYFQPKTTAEKNHPFTSEEKRLVKAIAERTARIIESYRAREALEATHDELEQRVAERTSELVASNMKLRREVEERKRTARALRENKAKNQAILNALPDIMFQISREGRFLSHKGASQDIHMDTAVAGKNVKEIFPGAIATLFMENIEKTITSNQIQIYEYQIPEEENIQYFECRMVKSTTNEVLAIIRNITEQRLMRRQLLQSERLASVGELAAGVAHEINNPINGIINYAQILIDEIEEHSPDADIPQRILKESERIAAIVRNLLSFARQTDDAFGPTSIKSVISDSLELIGKQISNDGILLHMEIPNDLPMVIVNGQKIQQVFMNLLSNARYALNQKYPDVHADKSLHISGKLKKNGKTSYISITFKDQGTGIDSAILDRVCEPFFSTKPQGKGTGLGLSISYGIIQDHHGSLTFESQFGEYTMATVDLPVPTGEMV